MGVATGLPNNKGRADGRSVQTSKKMGAHRTSKSLEDGGGESKGEGVAVVRMRNDLTARG